MRSALRIWLLALSSGVWAASANAAIGHEPIALPDGHELIDIDFERHIVPLLTRYGCNAATCHGSFQGRGGLRLSLFGHASKTDYEALLARVDDDEPADSLLLQKPTLLLDHEGGLRFEPESWPHQVLRRWIEGGATYASDPALHVISASQPIVLTQERPQFQLVIESLTADGKHEPVNAFCRFESRDPNIATVTEDGVLERIAPGTTHVIAQYGSHFSAVPVLVPYGSAKNDNRCDRNSFIDELINQQLAKLGVDATAEADDATFLRRVTLDTIGRLPTPAEIRAFVSSQQADKRASAIDRLLTNPLHGSLWATRLCDITGCRLESMEGPDDLRRMRARMWHDWFRLRIQANVPFDQIVRGVVCGDSREGRSIAEFIDQESKLLRAAQRKETTDYARRQTLDLFWRRRTMNSVYPRAQLAERIAAGFMGVRLQCAQCHKHPHDRWTQSDYAAFVNVFGQVEFGSSVELNRGVFERLEIQRQARERGEEVEPLPRLQEVYDSAQPTAQWRDPESGEPLSPRALDGPTWNADDDTRRKFAAWLTAPENPYFARNWVNRIWAHYFGAGLVEPVDGFSAINAPVIPELLDALATEFIRTGYDMRHMERIILNSAVYQHVARPASRDYSNVPFASFPVRAPMAEVMLVMMDQALGKERVWGGAANPSGQLLDVAADRLQDNRANYLLELFGRGEREAACDCGRQDEPTLRQALHLMSDSELAEDIESSSLLQQLAAGADQEAAIEELFLRTVSRFPTDDERQRVRDHLIAVQDPRAAWKDLIWVMLNSREMRTNH